MIFKLEYILNISRSTGRARSQCIYCHTYSSYYSSRSVAEAVAANHLISCIPYIVTGD